AYGKPGGRAIDGLYDPSGFVEINAVAGDGSGGLYVVENYFRAPRRAAHLAADGKLIREWYGGYMYANFGAADDADPSLVWLDCSFEDVVQAKVDYASKTWSVRANYHIGTAIA